MTRERTKSSLTRRRFLHKTALTGAAVLGAPAVVPTEDAFGPGGGGYETRLTSYSNLEITAGRQLRDAGLELAKQLKPGAVPRPPRPLPFGDRPWSYGNNRPEVK